MLRKLQIKKMKKLTCHCGGVEAEVKVPENGFEKLVRCNCSICKRKGYVIGVIELILTTDQELIQKYMELM